MMTLSLFLLFAITDFTASAMDKSALSLELLSVSSIKDGPDEPDRLFKPLDTVWLNLRVTGFMKNARNEIQFQADMKLSGADKTVIMEKANILDRKIGAGDIERPEINAAFNVDLYENILPGRYAVTISFRDLVSGRTGVFSTWFIVQK